MVKSQISHQAPLRAVMEVYASVTGAAYTAKAGDQVIGVNRAGTVTITLPSAQVRRGRIYTIKDESGAAATTNITVDTEGSETIDGLATDVIATDFGAKHYYSDGSNWFEVPLLPEVAHQAAHNSGGSDAMKLNDLAALDDNADLDFSTTAHGLVPKGTNTGNFLKDDGTWAAPSDGGSDISARIYHSANQSIANNSTTVLSFDTEKFDTDTIHSTSTNNSRLTCKTAGNYIIAGQGAWAASTSGIRMMEIRLNGTTAIARVTVGGQSTEDSPRVAITTLYKLAVNDYVELLVYQSSGVVLNLETLNDVSPRFMMAKVLA